MPPDICGFTYVTVTVGAGLVPALVWGEPLWSPLLSHFTNRTRRLEVDTYDYSSRISQ